MFGVLFLALLGSGFAQIHRNDCDFCDNYTSSTLFTNEINKEGTFGKFFSTWEWRDQPNGRYRKDYVSFPASKYALPTSEISTCTPNGQGFTRRTYSVDWEVHFWPENRSSSNLIPPPQSADFNDDDVQSCVVSEERIDIEECFNLNGWAPLCLHEGGSLYCASRREGYTFTDTECLYKPKFGGKCVKNVEDTTIKCGIFSRETPANSSSFYEITDEYGWIPNGRIANFYIPPGVEQPFCVEGGYAQTGFDAFPQAAWPKHPEIVQNRLEELGKCRIEK